MAAQQQPQTPAQPTASVPFTGSFSLRAKANAPPSQMAQLLSMLTFLEMSQEDDALVALNVESRDIQKSPYLFSITYFKPGKVETLYSCIPGMSPKKRRLEVLRNVLNMLTLLSDAYSVDTREIYQLLESSLADMAEYVTADYEKLFSEHDSLKAQVAELSKRARDLALANDSLSKENYDLKLKNDELVLKLKALETYSDSVLGLKIQDWIKEHGGEINILEFSRVHNVPEMRVEQILNRLVTEGYLEARK
ncbi:hypothetical protein J4441_05835 [Candidatus Micrarchaeota archaeon]|nr:hypothetical protein [Candidatus Micrarchaeota archaeon]